MLIVRGPESVRNYDVASDGRILGVVPVDQALSGVPQTPQIHVVVNWFQELQRLVPTK
jgi:hypothetical protein